MNSLKACTLVVGTIALAAAAQATDKPNIIVILADDLGYGDVHCLNPQRGKIPTPNLDKLAAQGMTFTDAHASASVCSPSRYALLTGRYNWRSRLQAGIVPLWGSPHTPITPIAPWKGASGLGPYADYVMETDAMVGRVLEALDKSGIADNTLLVFTSDNGCASYIGVPEMIKKGHHPSAQFRGYKFDIWDGGHREPFFVRWPGQVKPGTACSQMVCLTDIMATCAEAAGAKLPENAGVDSFSLLPLLRGEDKPVRETLISHSCGGRFAIREGNWKLILCSGSGSSISPKAPPVQLYDMSVDEGERKNLQAEHPEIVKRLTEKLKIIVADGRSTPGANQKNDVPVKILK